jgi:hypothetical protein
MNNKNMFVDTISAINVNNGIVKMNLVAQSSEQQPSDDNNNEPKFDDLGQITMPLNGFFDINGTDGIYKHIFIIHIFLLFFILLN